MKVLKCANCGANYSPRDRKCEYCDIVLINTGSNPVTAKTKISDSAFEKWRKILKSEPDNFEAHNALGLLYLNNNVKNKSVEHLRKAVKLAPERSDAHYNLALALFDNGRLSDASELNDMFSSVSTACKIDSDFQEAIAFKHFFYAKINEKTNPDIAIAEYHKAIEICSDIAPFHNNLGILYFNKKELQKAEEQFDIAFSLCPTYHDLPRSYINLYHEWTGGFIAKGVGDESAIVNETSLLSILKKADEKITKFPREMLSELRLKKSKGMSTAIRNENDLSDADRLGLIYWKYALYYYMRSQNDEAKKYIEFASSYSSCYQVRKLQSTLQKPFSTAMLQTFFCLIINLIIASVIIYIFKNAGGAINKLPMIRSPISCLIIFSLSCAAIVFPLVATFLSKRTGYTLVKIFAILHWLLFAFILILLAYCGIGAMEYGRF